MFCSQRPVRAVSSGKHLKPHWAVKAQILDLGSRSGISETAGKKSLAFCISVSSLTKWRFQICFCAMMDLSCFATCLEQVLQQHQACFSIWLLNTSFRAPILCLELGWHSKPPGKINQKACFILGLLQGLLKGKELLLLSAYTQSQILKSQKYMILRRNHSQFSYAKHLSLPMK